MVNIPAITTTVYKVVREKDGLLVSHVAEGSFLTVYTPDEWVQRNNLFVYTEKKWVEDIVGDTLQVWECETTTEPRRAPSHIPDFEYTFDTGYKGVSPEQAVQLIAEFFESPYGYREGPLELLWCSRNTYLVDDIKLVRRIA